MLKQEWKRLLGNKLMLLVVAAIIAIPAIYTTLFLGSMWDPYGKTGELPVAVVNKDKKAEYEGRDLEIGREMVEKLREDDSLDFHFPDEGTARAGLKDGTYYMVITIPEDFSARASSLTGENPRKMELLYATNPGTNYIASKMSETAMEKVKSSIREEVTRTYTEAVFDQISEAGKGMGEAAEGAGRIERGAGELFDGNDKITENLKTLAESSLAFREGGQTFTEGLRAYTQGAETVHKGAGALKEGAVQLKEGLSQLNGKAPELEKGTGILSQGISQLTEGAENAWKGSGVLKEGTIQSDESMKELNAGLDTLEQSVSLLPDRAEELDAGAEALKTGADNMGGGLFKLQEGVEVLAERTEEVKGGLAMAGSEAFSQIRQEAKELKTQIEAMEKEPGGAAQSFGEEEALEMVERSKEAYGRAQENRLAADSLYQVQSADPSFLYEALEQASRSGDMEATRDIAGQAIELASQNAQAAREAEVQIQTARDALYQGSEALSGAGESMEKVSGVLFQRAGITENESPNLEQISEGLQKIIDKADIGEEQLNLGITEGLDAVKEGMEGELSQGIQGLIQGTEGLKAGLAQVKAGTGDLKTAAPALAEGLSSAREGGVRLQVQGTRALVRGAEELETGLASLVQGSGGLKQGSRELTGKLPQLLGGVSQLEEGAIRLRSGTESLTEGTEELVSNNQELVLGSKTLGEGAVKISEGARRLYEGSEELGGGIREVEAGGKELKERLEEGEEQVKEKKLGEKAKDMFAAPVNIKESRITTVENNGHAMAPYMMSVALWVGCIAFSLMYPLTSYSGRLKSGTAWWAGKASVLYFTAVLQALVMVGLLHVFDGFEPVEMGRTAAVACLASVAFMSVMYFFTNTLGKAGSFLMLIFMVIQLAGSVGTYPLELSGSFVPYLHDWVPFTYTVEAFRSAISGGESIRESVVFLAVLWLVFTGLTIIEFQIRAGKIKRGKPTLARWLEKKGLA